MYSSTYNDVFKDSYIEKKIGDDLIEKYYVDSHALSVGMDPNIYKKNRLKEREDILISNEGVSAYISAVDFQFITTKNVIESIMSEWEELSNKLRNSEELFYKDLSILSLKCKNSKFDDNPEITAYIQVKDINLSNNEKVFIFNGWSFSSSPTLNPFDHPVYDLWLSSCKII